MLTKIDVTIVLRGERLDHGVVQRCVEMAEERFCPVWAMLAGRTSISSAVEILPEIV